MSTARWFLVRGLGAAFCCALGCVGLVADSKAEPTIKVVIKNRSSHSLILNPAATSTNGVDRAGKPGWVYSPPYQLGPNQEVAAKTKAPDRHAPAFFLDFQIHYRDAVDPVDGDWLQIQRTSLIKANRGLIAGGADRYPPTLRIDSKLVEKGGVRDRATFKVKITDFQTLLPQRAGAVLAPFFYERPDLTDLSSSVGGGFSIGD